MVGALTGLDRKIFCPLKKLFSNMAKEATFFDAFWGVFHLSFSLPVFGNQVGDKPGKTRQKAASQGAVLHEEAYDRNRRTKPAVPSRTPFQASGLGNLAPDYLASAVHQTVDSNLG